MTKSLEAVAARRRALGKVQRMYGVTYVIIPIEHVLGGDTRKDFGNTSPRRAR